jgi:hypothetical protein
VCAATDSVRTRVIETRRSSILPTNSARNVCPIPGGRPPEKFFPGRGIVNPPFTHKKKLESIPVAVRVENRLRALPKSRVFTCCYARHYPVPPVSALGCPIKDIWALAANRLRAKSKRSRPMKRGTMLCSRRLSLQSRLFRSPSTTLPWISALSGPNRTLRRLPELSPTWRKLSGEPPFSSPCSQTS